MSDSSESLYVTPAVGVYPDNDASTPYLGVYRVRIGKDDVGPALTDYEQAKTFAAGVLAGLEAGFHMGVAEEQAASTLRGMNR